MINNLCVNGIVDSQTSCAGKGFMKFQAAKKYIFRSTRWFIFGWV